MLSKKDLMNNFKSPSEPNNIKKYIILGIFGLLFYGILWGGIVFGLIYGALWSYKEIFG